MDQIKVTFFTHSTPNSPLEYLRVIGPTSNADITLFSGVELKEDLYNNIYKSDLIVIQRVFPAEFNLMSQILEISTSLRKPVIYDLDDNLFILPDNHPHRTTYGIQKVLLPMLFTALNVDCITVSTEYLRDSLKDLNQNIYVLPNFLDDSIWPITHPNKKKNIKPITIGYMGGESHYFDLEMIVLPLLDIKEKYNRKIRFHFYGVKPPEQLLAFPDTIWTPSKTYEYKDFIQDFRKLDFDIFIAPLLDDEFNRCKSPIKFMEYSALGVPGIYSRMTPYLNVITDGVNGMLASNLDEWREKIQLLIDNPDLRYQLAINAQNFVKDQCLMSKNSYLWENIYHQVVNQGKSGKTLNSVPKQIVDAITYQSIEYQKFMDVTEANTLTELNISENKIDNLLNEISAYHTEAIIRENEIDFLKNNLLSLRIESTEHETKIKDQSNEISELKTKLKFGETEINKNNDYISELKTKLIISETEIEKNNNYISELKTKLIVSETEIKKIKNYISELENKLIMGETEINNFSNNISALKKIKIDQEHMIQNIYSDVATLQDLLHHRDQEIVKLKQDFDSLEEEVLFYALSRSWRFTRPLRKIKQLIGLKKNA